MILVSKSVGKGLFKVVYVLAWNNSPCIPYLVKSTKYYQIEIIILMLKHNAIEHETFD